MQAWSRLWRQIAQRPAQHSWGMASDGDNWTLVGLSLQKSTEIRVHVVERIILAPLGPSGGGFSDGLHQAGARVTPSERLLNVALKPDEMVTGVLELPAHLQPDHWASEVQLEVSQLLGLEPDQVNFDFQPDPVSAGLLSRLHWVGCDQERIRSLKHGVRSADWQLHSVEPAWHAAYRAARHLKGGLTSLLTQPVQDWQFGLANLADDRSASESILGAFGPDMALTRAMQSAAGPRLVASGLALKAWR